MSGTVELMGSSVSSSADSCGAEAGIELKVSEEAFLSKRGQGV